MTAWLTEKDAQDYGYDVLDLAQRAAMHAVSPELQRINEQNESLRRQLAAEQRRGLYQSLDTQVPNWREIDNSLEWRQWLAGGHDLSGCTRQQLLNDALARGDAARVARFFRDFLREAGQPPQGQQQQRQATGQRTYTRADITRYSDAYWRGRISEGDYQKISADIVAAGREGRIVGVNPPLGKAPHG